MKLVYKCRECGKPFVTEAALSEHIRSGHMIQIKEYYDKYVAGENEGKCLVCGEPTEFVSMSKGYRTKCAKCNLVKTNLPNDPNNEKFTKLCELCKFNIAGSTNQILMRRFYYHIKKHGFTPQDYYDKFERKPDDGVCPICGKPTEFISITEGYRKYCSPQCVNIAARAERERLRQVEHEFQDEQKEIKKSREDAMKDYIQALKAEAHKYDWEGERNSWMGGPRTQTYGGGNNLLTDNSVSYLDGQSFNTMDDTIETNENQSFDEVFWL